MKAQGSTEGLVRRSRRLHLIGIGISLVTGFVFSNIATAQSNSDEQMEQIVVTGVKRAVQDARNAKYDSNDISDSYFAEDIGKSSDESITDALQRIPGVTINRGGEFGDAGTITIRGIAPELNNVTLNGLPLTSDSVDLDIGVNSQAVNLSVFSADILQRIDVIKTPSAKQEEGALGGTVNLYTVSPFDRDDTLVLSLQARHNDFSGDTNPRATASFSKVFNDRWGFSGTLFYDGGKGRRDTYETFVGAFVDPRNGGINAETGQPFTYDVGVPTWVSDPNGDGINDVYALADGFNNYRTFLQDNSKFGGSLTLQFRPNDETDARFDVTYSDQTQEFMMWEDRGLQASFIASDLASQPNGTSIVDPNSGIVLKWENPINDILAQVRQQHGGTKTLVASGKLVRKFGEWTLSALAGQSKSDRYTWFDSYNGRPQIGSVSNPGEYCGWEMVNARDGNILPNYFACPRVNVADASTLYLRSGTLKEDDVLDKKNSIFVDLNRELEWGPVNSIDFGAKYTDRRKDNYSSEDFYFLSTMPFPGNPTEIPFTSFDTRMSPGNVLGGLAPSNIGPIAYPTIASIYDVLFSGENGGPTSPFDLYPTRNEGRIKRVDETTSGAYVQLNFEDLSGRLSGNIGVRYAKTEVKGFGSIGYTFNPGYINPNTGENYPGFYSSPRSDKNDYSDILPSLNIRYDISDDFVARFSAAKTIARPALGFLAPGESVRDVGGGSPPTAEGRNTQLDPFESNQVDLSLEWYFNDTGMLSAAFFHKDLRSFNYSTTRPKNFENPVTGEPCIVNRQNTAPGDFFTASVAQYGCIDVLFTSEYNGATGEITGFELGYTQLYTSLPGWLRYFGLSANFTYADSRAQNNPEDANDPTNGLPFLNTSKNSMNTALFWENDKFSVRLAQSYRSKALLILNTNNSTVFRDGRNTLDLSAVYSMNDNLEFTLTANNLTNSYERLFKVTTDQVVLTGPNGETFAAPYIPGQLTTTDINNLPDDRIHRIAYDGRNFSVGFRYSF